MDTYEAVSKYSGNGNVKGNKTKWSDKSKSNSNFDPNAEYIETKDSKGNKKYITKKDWVKSQNFTKTDTRTGKTVTDFRKGLDYIDSVKGITEEEYKQATHADTSFKPDGKIDKLTDQRIIDDLKFSKDNIAAKKEQKKIDESMDKVVQKVSGNPNAEYDESKVPSQISKDRSKELALQEKEDKDLERKLNTDTSELIDQELVEMRDYYRAQGNKEKEAELQAEINRRDKDGENHFWQETTETVESEPDIENQNNTQEYAGSVGLDISDEEALKAQGEDGTAEKALGETKAEISNNGKPLSEEEFNSIFPNEKPESALDWKQRWAPLMTVASLAITAIGMANGEFIPPINFNKLTNRNEAYASYLSIMEEDQKQKNADANTISSPMDAYEAKQKFDAEHGEGAYDEGVTTFGGATAAGQMATQEQVAEQELTRMATEHGYDLEKLDAEERNIIEQMTKNHELEMDMEEIRQTWNIDNITLSQEYELAKLKQAAQNDQALARVVSELESTLDARSIAALEGAGKSVNDYAQWMKARGGKTGADTVREYIDTVGNTASNTIDAVVPM